MSPREEVTLPATRPKSRKSLAHVPSASQMMDQENMTADLGALAAANGPAGAAKSARKSRSKSIGPGGLDALTNGSGNRCKVGDILSRLSNSANMNTVIGICGASSTKIYFETYNARPPRNSAEKNKSKKKPKEEYPACTFNSWGCPRVW